MKRKHYPLVTLVAASLLTLVPLLIIFLSLSSDEPNVDAAIDRPVELGPRSMPAFQTAPLQKPVSTITETTIPPTLNVTPDAPTSPLIAERPPIAKQEVAQLPKRLAEIHVATPVVSNPVRDVPPPVDATLASIESHQGNALVAADAQQDWPVVADAEVIEPPKRAETGVNYYEATGHLAMRTQPQVPDPVNYQTKPATSKNELQERSDSDEGASAKSRHSKGRKSKSDEKASAEANANSKLPFETTRLGSRARTESNALLEDVAVQTPQESAPVGRVENVVAVTNARGWPIALIRSNLPDDVWWVQQMIGIQDHSLAARVNFGNEYSLSGSEYCMVIVFLDSPDEVRRFRIAKQFREIPEGVRRSREFHYIRN